jgi:uncharacterized membrane protein YdbT with pleckstrin-like domain
MEEKFNDIIEKDEKIVKAYKPNRKKFWWGIGIILFCSSIWAVALLILSLVLPEELSTDDDGYSSKPLMIIVACIWIAAALISLVFIRLYYKNKYYCYTDRRVIIRSGIFGVDYASLEFKSLTATMVQVSLLDKILRTGTGTIKFGSASSQITGGNSPYGGAANPYTFRHIEKPYEVMREIKEHIGKNA